MMKTKGKLSSDWVCSNFLGSTDYRLDEWMGAVGVEVWIGSVEEVSYTC